MPAHSENRVKIDGDTARIELTQGQFGLIDAADVPLLAGHKWYAHYRPTQRSFMVVANGRRSLGEGGKLIYLHRLILDAPSDKQVDHINHDTLDNRRANLRIVTPSENQQNRRGANPRSRTGVRGVGRWSRGRHRYWTARVTVLGRTTMKYFPYTEEGFQQASAAAAELRQRLHISP